MKKLTIKQKDKILAEAYENRMPGSERIEITDLEEILNANTEEEEQDKINISP